MSIEPVMPSSHLILCRPLLLLPPIPSSIGVFSNESNLHMKWPKYWISALASFLPMNTQEWSPLGWTGWTSLQSKGLTRVFSSTTVQKQQFFGTQLSSQSNSHIHTWPLEKPQSWLDGEVNSFVQKQYPKMLRLYYWKSDPRSMVISNPVAILGFWRQESFS